MNAIKLTYITLGATLLLFSCSQEETIDHGNAGSDRRIIFHTALPNVTTRSHVLTKENFNSFQLTAFNPADEALTDKDNGTLREYINNKPLTKEGDKPISSENCIWPEPGKEGHLLRFFAFYPPLSEHPENEVLSEDMLKLKNNSRVENGVPTIDYKMENFRVAEDIADHIDFVTAYATGSMEENLFSGINLNFQHQLSRIEIKAWGANKISNIEIAGVRIGGVNIGGTFNFVPDDGAKDSGVAGHWETGSLSKGKVEYVFRNGDKIISLNQTSADNAVSLMGNKIDDSAEDNCAMLIPSAYTKWDYTNDKSNSGQGMYLSVLLRVTDPTSSDNNKQIYPYTDDSYGENTPSIPVIYLAVAADGKVNGHQLYKDGNGNYYTDLAKTTLYTAPEGTVVKEFGWAALPMEANWEVGYIYTYVLDYSYGIGLHDPSVPLIDATPKPGDAILSDKVGIKVDVNKWNTTEAEKVEVPES